MLLDQFNNPVTTATPDAITALNTYANEFLSYGPGLGQIIAAAEATPDCLSLQAHAAAVHMALEATSGFRAAAPFLQRANALEETGTQRERAFLAACRYWMGGDIGEAARLLTEVAERWPSDLVAAKWAQYHAFNRGDAALMKRAADAIIGHDREQAFVWGMLAFAKEQLHDMRGAEEGARRAIEIEPTDAWAHHALAHVMETEGRLDEGIAFLDEMAPTWDDKSIFIREHNWWHRALFHLDKDEPDTVLEIYDRRLWGEWPEFAQEQIGAISALWRLELRGVDVGDRWASVAEKVAERDLEHVLPFHDLHYVFALARGGKIDRLTAYFVSLENKSRSDTPETEVWRQTALPVGRAVAALGQGHFSEGARRLGPLLGSLQRIGGSHAQRDLFNQAHIDALVRSGQWDEAVSLIDERAKARPAASALQKLLAWARKEAYAPS